MKKTFDKYIFVARFPTVSGFDCSYAEKQTFFRAGRILIFLGHFLRSANTLTVQTQVQDKVDR